MGGAHRATAIGFVSAFSRLPVHPANTKANNRAMILIRAIPFCQVSKQERRRGWNAIIGIGGWKYDPREKGKARDHALPLGASGGGAVSRERFMIKTSSHLELKFVAL